MFKRKKQKTGCETPEIKEFENYTNLIIIPRCDKLNEWEECYYIPYKDEILVGYNDIRVIYKLGDGIHRWDDLPESTIEEVLAFGYVFHTSGRYKIKFKLIPTRTMRIKEN